MQRHKITLSYDGTGYFGWQVQPREVSVQGSLEQALNDLSSETIKVHGSGRTDQGVHARRQVAHFDMAKDFGEKQLARALNAVLPEDIRVLSSARVDQSFHARKSVTGKEYRYLIWNHEVMPPFLRKYRSHVRTALDLESMADAAGDLTGLNDFRSFCSSRYKEERNFVRDLRRLDVSKKGSEITIIAEGSGFLYKMVRSLAGYLIKVGKGGADPSGTKDILQAKERTHLVETAPPNGLFLWNVKY